MSNAPGANTPLGGVTVTLTGAGNQTTMTNASGRYSFTVTPGGPYTVTPSGFGRTYEPIRRTYPNVTTNITNADFLAFIGTQRDLSVMTTFVETPDRVSLPIILRSLGNERTLRFSLLFNNALLNTPLASCGPDAPGCVITQVFAGGAIGITVTLATPLVPGARDIVRVRFDTVAGTQSNTPVVFGDSPTARLITDAAGNPLSSTYTGGFVVFSARGLEADVAPRFAGDGLYRSIDVEQERLFVSRLQQPSGITNEFERADVAPYATRGDGRLNAVDFQLVINYVSGLVEPQMAGGPDQPIALPPATEPDTGARGPENRDGREFRASKIVGAPDSFVSFPVEIISGGRETVTTLGLQFNPKVLRLSPVSGTDINPDVTAGSGANPGTSITVNALQLQQGRIGVLLDFRAASRAGTRELVVFRFRILPDAASGSYPITFVDEPIERSTSDANAKSLNARYTPGSIVVEGPIGATSLWMTPSSGYFNIHDLETGGPYSGSLFVSNAD